MIADGSIRATSTKQIVVVLVGVSRAGPTLLLSFDQKALSRRSQR